MDTVNLLLNPRDTIMSRIIAPLRIPLEAVVNREDSINWADYAIQITPFLGSISQRNKTSQIYYDDTHNILNKVLPSLIGRSKVDSWIDKYIGNPNFDTEGNWIGPRKEYTPYNKRPIGFNWYQQPQAYKDKHRYVKGVSYVPKTYMQNKTKYPSQSKMYNEMITRNGQAKLTRSARSIWYNKTDVYRDIFTSKAKSRFKINMLPVSPKNVMHQVHNLWRFL
jgi:hypothetical protein